MKLIKTLLLLVAISAITFSCKETKKEKVEGEMEAVEETVVVEEDGTDGSTEVVEVEKSATTAAAKEPTAVAVESSTVGLEETVIEGVMVEAMADTPVIYPGCEGSVDEIRACSIQRFTEFLKKNFNPDRAADLNYESGQHTIRALVKVDQTGKATVLKVQDGHKGLDKEISRVIDEMPVLIAATEEGQPVSVSFILPLTFSIM
jgi:protein TonB